MDTNYYCTRRCYSTGATNVLNTNNIEKVRIFIDRFGYGNVINVFSEKHSKLYEFGCIYDNSEGIDYINNFKNDLRNK